MTPLSLGTDVEGGAMDVLISRNTVIPSKKTASYTTVNDNQEGVDVTIFEGERPMARDNHKLAKFWLGGIPPAPKGTPDLQVTFEVRLLYVFFSDIRRITVACYLGWSWIIMSRDYSRPRTARHHCPCAAVRR